MNRLKSHKNVRRAAAGLLLCALLALGLTPLPIGGRFAAKSLSLQLLAGSGLHAAIDSDDVRFVLLPFPKVKIAGLRISDSRGRALAAIGAAEAHLRLLDFAGGRFRFTSLALLDAVIDFATPESRAAWRAAGQRMLAPQDANRQYFDGASFRIAVIRTGGGDFIALEGKAAWDGPGAPLSLQTRGSWKNEE